MAGRGGGKGKAGAAGQRQREEPTPSVEDRATWLLRFLQADVKTLRTGELIDAGSDAVRYLLEPSSMLASGEFQEVGHGFNPDIVSPTPGAEIGDAPLLQRPTLAQVQRAVRGGLDELHAGTPWRVPNTPDWTLRPQPDGTLSRIYKGSAVAMLVASAAELLTAVWPRVRRCAYAPCGLFFLQSDGRQRYHDARCSGTARYERFKPKRDHARERERANELHPSKELPAHIQNETLMAKHRKGRK